MIFQLRTAVLIDDSATVLLRVLDRWDQLWAESMQRITDVDRQSLGLARYAPEFALLFRRIVEAGSNIDGDLPTHLQYGVMYDTASLNRFIQQCCV